MAEAVDAALPCDVAIMVAAVADWRVAEAAGQKRKKDGSGHIAPLELVDGVKVRYGDYRTVSRQRSMPPVHDAEQITRYALELLHETDVTTRPVRLLGVSLHRLEPRDAPHGSAEAPTLPF